MIMVSPEKFFTRYTVRDRDAEPSFKEEESFLELKERILFRIFDYWPEETIVLV